MGETIDAQIEELIMSDIEFADGIFPKAPPPNARPSRDGITIRETNI